MNENAKQRRAAESAERNQQRITEQRNINQRATRKKEAVMPGTKTLEIIAGD